MRSKIFTQFNFKKDIYTKAWSIARDENLRGNDKINRLNDLIIMIIEMHNFNYINTGLCQDLSQLITLLKLSVLHDFDKYKEMYEDE